MIRIIRRSKDVTQQQLAEIIGVDRSTVAKWERKKCNPSEKNLLKIANALNCTMDELIGNKEETENVKTR